MEKLNLNLDDLSVDSFHTDAAAAAREGTVRGQTLVDTRNLDLCGPTWVSCDVTCESCLDTCDITCGETCGSTCGSTCDQKTCGQITCIGGGETALCTYDVLQCL
jgi:hypothetical protein